MAITHYIDSTSSEISRAKIKSTTQRVPEAFPTLVFGDNRDHNFIFWNGQTGSIESYSGNASYSLRVTIGNVDEAPIGGNYSLTCGSTTTLTFSSDAVTIQDALNALTTITTEGGVTVTGTFPDFLVTWNTTGIKTSITADATKLIPLSSVSIITTQTGSSSVLNQVAIQLRQAAITTQTTWTVISSPAAGWTGTLNTNTAGALILLGAYGKRVGGFVEAATILTAEVLNNSGVPISYFQTPVTIRAKNLDASNAATAPLPNTLPALQLGDLLYGTSANAIARLPGVSNITRKFLTQAGDGTGSAQPNWVDISDDDLPASQQPQGPNTAVQINIASNFYGDANFTYDPANGKVTALRYAGTWTSQINASNVNTGTVPVAQLYTTATAYNISNGSNIDGVGSKTWSGSGNLVLATSPALITPNIGTPSYGVLSNATGLPISTGVSGLGTNVATALAINIGSAGAPVIFNGDAGNPSALVGTNISGTASSLIAGNATKWTTPRTITITGDLNYTSAALDGSSNVSGVGTLGTVNPNVGTFGSATQSPTITVNGKGLVTAASGQTITPSIGSITGLGTGVAAALAVNIGSAGAPVLFNGAGGTPSSLTLTNATGLSVSTGISGLGTGVATALAVNTGSAGAFVINGGALGTPSSGIVTNLTGTASININGTVGATTPAAGSFTTLGATGNVTSSAGGFYSRVSGGFNMALGSAEGLAIYYDFNVFQASRTSGSCLDLRRQTTDGAITQFYRDTTQVGSISVTTTATAYNTSSDRRLKTNIREVDHARVAAALDKVLIRDYDWRANSKPGIGPIAQELAAADPIFVTLGAVTQGDDAVIDYDAWRARKARVNARADRNEKRKAAHKQALEDWQAACKAAQSAAKEADRSPVVPIAPIEPVYEHDPEDDIKDFVQWQVDNSKLVPLLLDYAQQTRKELKSLEARVAALEAK